MMFICTSFINYMVMDLRTTIIKIIGNQMLSFNTKLHTG